MKLSSGKLVTHDTPIYPGSNFTWGEATKNCTRHIQDLLINRTVIITAGEIERNIIATARAMDDYRALLNNRPIKVTSWYRPAHINSRVGGSQYSRHQYGDAVDWISYYFTPRQIAKILKANHTNGGYKDYSGFTHTDWRGWKARW